MTDFQRKRNFKKIIYSNVSFLILFILVIFLGRANYNIYKKSKLSSGNNMEVTREYESLKSRKDMLESEINRLKTDGGIEEEIRGKFNVAKPGETVVTVINSSGSIPTNVNNLKKGFWSNLWNVFK